MKLGLSDLRAITLGAVYIEETEEGFLFHRFTKEQEELYREKKEERLYERCSYTAGIKLSFVTDSEEMTLRGTLRTVLSKRRLYSFDLVVNGVFRDRITNIPHGMDPHDALTPLPVDSFGKTFRLGRGEKLVELYLPWSTRVAMREISLDDGAVITPVRPEKKYMCFGDSITQGFDGFSPSANYTALLAKAFGAEQFNKAIGGEVFFSELGDTRDAFDPDYITVAYGTNDFGTVEPDSFRKNCRGFLKALSGNYPSSRIFAVSPIWRKAYLDHPNTRFGSFFEVEDEIRSCAEKLDNVTFIRGFDLVPHDPELYADRTLHPSDEGFAHYAKNLYAAISRELLK